MLKLTQKSEITPIVTWNYNPVVRNLLKDFLINFKNKLIYHNSIFDAHVLIYQLFMDELVDIKGLLYGLEVLTRNFEDTKLIAYLCLNSTARPLLSLKELSKSFSGKYSLDDSAITNIRNVPLDELLRYNLIDGLSTWYVYNTYTPKLSEENQTQLYEEIFKPAAIDLIHTQLIGMPVSPIKVNQAKIQLKELIQESLTALQSTDFIKDTESYIKTQWVIMKNNTLKVKRVSLDDCKETFNPNSDKHVQILLYIVMGFTATIFTDTGQPSTSGDTLLDLKIRANPEQKYVLEHLIKIGEASKILSTFIPALEKAICAEDGNTYLYGNFNLGSTVSGRLSSSDPNLQNTPANSTYGKLIKSCFISTEDLLFCGVDFNSLEARIGALLPKDQNKLDIYRYGYDSHSYNTNIYWPNKLPDVLQKLMNISNATKFYEVTDEQGDTSYYTDLDLPMEKNYE